MLRSQYKRALSGAVVLALAAFACNLPEIPRPAQQTSVSSTQSSTSTNALVTEMPTPVVEVLPSTPSVGDLEVVYTSEDNLFLWSNGNARKLTNSGDVFNPRLSPDGKMISFLRPADEFHLELWVIQADGASERRLVSIADMDVIAGGVRDSSAVAVNPYAEYGWIPGSHQLAFTSQQIFLGPGLNLLNDLNLVNADSGEIKSLFLSGWGGMFTFSLDGKRVAVIQPDKIIVANIDGSDYRTLLTYDPVTTYSEYRYYASPVWSPEGNYLLVSIPPVDPLAPPPQFTELWQIPIDEEPASLLGKVQTVAFFEQAVSFSPDLKMIAYIQESGSPDQNTRELHLAKNDGSGDWIYAKASPLYFQSWSPDSTHFAYTVGNENETWIGDLSLAPQVLDRSFSGAQSLRWTNANQFLYWLPKDNVFELHLATPQGGATILDTAFGGPPIYSFTQH